MFIHVFRQNSLMNNKMVIWFVYDNADLMTKTEDLSNSLDKRCYWQLDFSSK